jgi:hypothetical protein
MRWEAVEFADGWHLLMDGHSVARFFKGEGVDKIAKAIAEKMNAWPA